MTLRALLRKQADTVRIIRATAIPLTRRIWKKVKA
jgi:hypothetical protein